MDRADIPAWLESTRATAKTQMERWQGVDPSRLLEACDLIEQLLQPNAPALSELHSAPYVPPIDDSIKAGEIAERFSREWGRLRQRLHASSAYVPPVADDPVEGVERALEAAERVVRQSQPRRLDTILDVELGRYLRVVQSARDPRIRDVAQRAIERIGQEAYQVVYRTTDPHLRAYAQSLIEQIDTAQVLRDRHGGVHIAQELRQSHGGIGYEQVLDQRVPGVPLTLLHVTRERCSYTLECHGHILPPGTSLLRIEAVLHAPDEERAFESLVEMIPHVAILPRAP